SNVDGFFKLTKVPAGTSRIIISAANFESWNKKIIIKQNRNLVVALISIAATDLPDAPQEQDEDTIAAKDTVIPNLVIKKKEPSKRQLRKKRRKERRAARREKGPTEEQIAEKQYEKKETYERRIEDVIAFE